jgi:hypothetical protein
LRDSLLVGDGSNNAPLTGITPMTTPGIVVDSVSIIINALTNNGLVPLCRLCDWNLVTYPGWGSQLPWAFVGIYRSLGESGQIEHGDVVVLPEGLRSLRNGLRRLGADGGGSFEAEEVAGVVAGFDHPVSDDS